MDLDFSTTNWKIKKLDLESLNSTFEFINLVYSSSKIPIGGGWSINQIEEEIKRSENLSFIFEPFGESIAILFWQDISQALEIRFLATHPRFQGRGVMTEVLRYFQEKVSKNRSIWLEVHEKNISACKLYEKMDFKRVGVRKAYYRDGSSAFLYSKNGIK